MLGFDTETSIILLIPYQNTFYTQHCPIFEENGAYAPYIMLFVPRNRLTGQNGSSYSPKLSRRTGPPTFRGTFHGPFPRGREGVTGISSLDFPIRRGDAESDWRNPPGALTAQRRSPALAGKSGGLITRPMIPSE